MQPIKGLFGLHWTKNICSISETKYHGAAIQGVSAKHEIKNEYYLKAKFAIGFAALTTFAATVAILEPKLVVIEDYNGNIYTPLEFLLKKISGG